MTGPNTMQTVSILIAALSSLLFLFSSSLPEGEHDQDRLPYPLSEIDSGYTVHLVGLYACFIFQFSFSVMYLTKKSNMLSRREPDRVNLEVNVLAAIIIAVVLLRPSIIVGVPYSKHMLDMSIAGRIAVFCLLLLLSKVLLSYLHAKSSDENGKTWLLNMLYLGIVYAAVIDTVVFQISFSAF